MLLCKVLAHCPLMETVWVSVPSPSTLQSKFIRHTLQLVHEQGLKLIIRNSFLLLSFRSLLNLILQLVTTCCHADGFFYELHPGWRLWFDTSLAGELTLNHAFWNLNEQNEQVLVNITWHWATEPINRNSLLLEILSEYSEIWEKLKSLREIVIIPHQLYSKCASSYHPESLCWHM